ncbi:MAG: bifunctional 4-hydroxy-2-oxoglutarate aldolase/2-dehydro-3-deoxy-phosphogluconate aldolase [Clostridia bacterium]|nr:bifunctional 4-hydroxy-2-oxoglutarate aldolase/2-dehydro-3-deoxy-phosphogluconate aldolase [Clostridia bacterium]
MKEKVLNKIKSTKLMAVVRAVYGEDAIKLAHALCEGGIDIIEMTFDQKDADCLNKTAEVIRLLKKEMGDKMIVGVGTALTVKQAQVAIDAGSEFVVSPDTNEEVIKLVHSAGVVSIPGALTPTEVMTAVRAGADMVKISPISAMGAGYIKALRGPINNVDFIVTGGVNEKNVGEFLSAGAVGAGVGGNLVSKTMIKEGRFDEITALAREYSKAVK